MKLVTPLAFQQPNGLGVLFWPDFDLDGLNDLFVTNGILGATNDMDFINFIADQAIQKQLGASMKRESMRFIEAIPAKKTPNYILKNRDGQAMDDQTGSWIPKLPSYQPWGGLCRSRPRW